MDTIAMKTPRRGYDPDASAGAAAGLARLWPVLGALMLALLLASLDQTIVATALPTIVRELGGLYQLSWVVTAYLLASTASTPLWGKLGDLYGRKHLFQLAIGLFLFGSGLCGLSQNLAQLVGFRALQGLGAGGLFVTAQAIIADLVSPRERGRYQGLLGAGFGVSSVAGPLLGGWFVENVSWRWVFYVNLPIGLVTLLVIAAVLRLPLQRRPHVLDYPGAVLITLAATGLVLLTTLGGTSFPWLSGPIVGLAVGSVALLAAFVWVERRAAEPVIPLTLFRSRVFSLAVAIGFVIVFALVGAITYVSLFLQVVNRLPPTSAGLRLVPMMAGIVVASITGGQLMSRWGRYKPLSIVGSALMTLGLFLLSGLDEQTEPLTLSAYLLTLGLGTGLVIQVLIIVVQNAVEYRDVGVATFGALFANLLPERLAESAGSSSSVGDIRALSDSAGLHSLPPEAQAQILHAVASSLDGVFLAAVPIVALAFVLSPLLPEVPLREGEAQSARAEPSCGPTGGEMDRVSR
jgi:EmrB/QacA subfamily drug resistance transporter